MQDSQFSFTTRQTARTVGASVEAVRAQYRRTGSFRGVTPIKLPTRRLLWPRAAVLALADLVEPGARTTIDLRATVAWLRERGLPSDDPMASAIAFALCDPRDDESLDPQVHLDDLIALRHWIEAKLEALRAATTRLSAEQRTDALRLLALAVAKAVAEVPEPTISQAMRDVIGGAA